ncbi:MAG: hypothetical protein NZZ41_07260 [Candidatus Dojkabacteria bacterium]|nr:hypothetical protein [Candidatus Dojkabacteria bacterium]
MHENILLKQEAEKVGFWALPPTVDEFLDYIGLKDNVYEYWKTHLRSIFPDNIHVSNNYVLLTGAIGTGKSTVSKISALYTLCRLLMLKNLDYFHLTITKPIQFLFFHVKIEKARAEFVSYVEEIVQTNKFFRYLINERKKVKDAKPMPFQFVSDGARSNSSIGGDVLFYVFSEANFVNENVISFKIDQAYKRFKSRFLAAMPYMGNIIIDTSASFEGAISDVLSDKDDFYTVRASQWDVKPFLYFKKGHFLVYTGGIDTGAKILHEDEDLSKYESGKIIKVPKELEREFKSNIHTALLDLAGLNIRAPNAIFNTEILSDVVNKENYFPDTDIIFNLPNYCDLLKKILDSNAYYYMHVDTSIKGDNTGIALATWKSDNKIHIDFCCGLHNNGEEIPMYIIQEFIEKMLKLGINIHKVSADSFQSYKLLQDITRIYRIQTQIINIDSMPSVYFALKNLL